MKFFKIIIFIVIILDFIIYSILFARGDFAENKNETIISPIATIIGQTIGGKNSLEKGVENVLSNSTGTYSVFVKNLKTGEVYERDADRVYEAASLYKLWVVAEAFAQIQNGKLLEDTELKEKAEVLNEKFDIASESAEIKEGEIETTVGEAIEKTIVISDNYEALILSAKVRLFSVKRFLTQNGLLNSLVSVPPTTTAKDIGLFYEKLYKGELLGEENTQKYLSLLKNQRLNDRIPKELPQDVQVAHKTGEIGEYKHDGGIVYGAKGDYIIVVLSESNNPAGAAQRIANISKAVYEYFDK